MILAIVNEKGGVAKTTTTVNLAAALAEKGRALVLDLDSQGSCSLALGVPRAELAPCVADAVLDETPLQDLVRRTNVENLDLVPASRRLATADIALAGEIGREYRLTQALEGLRDAYDYILLDCGPALGLLTVNALVAADHYMVPVTPAYLSLEGTANLQNTAARVRRGIGRCAELLGLVLTKVDRRNGSTVEIIRMLRRQFGKQVLETEIPLNVRLAEAPSFGKSIFQHDSKCAGSQAYRALAQEVLSLCGESHEKAHRQGNGRHLRGQRGRAAQRGGNRRKGAQKAPAQARAKTRKAQSGAKGKRRAA